MKDKSFHNSTKEAADQLELFEKTANRQEIVILSLFKRNPRMTASECFRMYPDRNVPLTSIRRGITNLTKSGSLIKLDGSQGQLPDEEIDESKIMKKVGIYGRKEYVYEINLKR